MGFISGLGVVEPRPSGELEVVGGRSESLPSRQKMECATNERSIA